MKRTPSAVQLGTPRFALAGVTCWLMKPIFESMTRAKVLKIWFTVVGLAVVAAIALGANITIGTSVLLGGLALVPAGIVWMLWPAARSLTAGDVLRGTDPRN